MRYIKKYSIFESVTDDQFFKTYNETQYWLNDMRIYNYTINSNLTVDVDDNINLYGRDLNFFPIQFGNIKGSFCCKRNNLRSLKGCPLSMDINKEFNCCNNWLTDLKYAPECKVIDCEYNFLETLEGCPKIVERLNIGNNKIKSLNGISENLNSIYYHRNPIEDILDIVHEKNLYKFIKYLNEYDVINKNILFLDKLKDALYMIDKNLNDINKFIYDSLNKNYNVIE